MKYTHLLILIALTLGFTPENILGCSQDYWKADEYYQNSSSQKEAASDLLKCVNLNENTNILDVGCGDGKITAEIATIVAPGSVVGVDISPSMIEFAQATFSKEAYPNLSFFIKDALQLDYTGQFDLVVSLTALQWVQDHNAFLEGARKSLKPSGILAVTMPMGLPFAIEQAVTELISNPKWSPYFQNFSTGWNFVDADTYATLLTANEFTSSRLAVVPQKDIFPSRQVFEKFIGQWFPYLRPLPQELKQPFLELVIDRFLELDAQASTGEVAFKIRRLEVVAQKNSSSQ